MIKKLLLIFLFVIVAIAIAIYIKPNDDELVYVYEKAHEREKLKEKYDVLVEENPKDIKLQEKQLENLKELQDEEYIDRLISFYEQNKTKENLAKIIDHYKAKENYDEILKWYEKEYKEFSTISSLEEIIKLASYTEDKQLQAKYLKEKYEKTKQRSILFELYNIDEKEYALTRLKEIALKTKEKELIFTLYGLNEKNFSLDILKKLALKNKLLDTEYLKTIELLIYEKRFKDSFKLYKRKKLKNLNVEENIELYEYMLTLLQNTPELKKLYKYAYKVTSEDKYFNNLVTMYLDNTDIETSINLYKLRYKKTKDLKYLEDIIYLYYTNDNQEQYLKHLEIKALKTKDIITLKYIISEYLDMDNFNLVSKLLNKIEKLTPQYDEFNELYLLTLVHTNQQKKAEREFIRYMPKNPSANVVYAVYGQRMNKISMPYFMEILKDTKDDETKAKLFRYRYRTFKLFKPDTYKYFGKANTFKKLSNFMQLLPNEDKIKNYLKFAKKSEDPMFLSEIGLYFMSSKDYKNAEKFLKKANAINPKNLYAIDYLARVKTSQTNYDEALRLLHRYNELKPNDPIINYRIAEILYVTNKKEESRKFYRTTIGHIQADSETNKAIVLKSRARLGTNLKDIKTDYEDIIVKSDYNEFITTEYLNLYIEDKQYDEALTLIDKYKEQINTKEFKKVQINALSGSGNFNEAKKLINKLLKENENRNDSSLYEQLGFINLALNKNRSAIKAFNKSIKLGSTNKELAFLNNELKKRYKNSIGFKAGIRNKIKEGQIKASYVHKNLFKVSVQNDIYEKYNSAKVLFEDVDEKYILGVGKDYAKVGFSNLFNATKLSLFFEKSIDIGTKKTIADELIYDRYNFTIASSVEQILFYNASFDFYRYDKFRRKRFAASVYYPFAQNYFTTISYVYEDVSNPNIYGYERINAPTLVFGRNYKVNENFSYLASLGAEFRDGNVNALSNLDFTYKNSDLDIYWNNGFSKDNLTDEYNFTSLFNFTYFY